MEGRIMSRDFIRKYTEEERVKIVEEALACESNSLVAAKYYNINSGLVFNWKCNYRRYKQTLKPKNTTQTKDKEIIVDYKKADKKTKEKCKDVDL